jgi:ATP-dependent Clp protease ATP-binding subunit ClpA
MDKQMLCSRCHERIAMIFVTKLENGETKQEGYCLKCARELHIPHVQDVLDRFGVSDDELDAISNQMSEMIDPDEGFNPGGAQPFPSFLQNFFQQGEGLTEQPDADEEDDEPAPAKKDGKRKKLKFLDNYCENLTQKARDGRVDNLIGREREIERVMQILNRRQKNNPCLIGEPGVGKTAIAEGIAQRLASHNVPPRLEGKELYLLDLTALVAGTQFRGQFESRVKGLVEEIRREGNVILFIDEVHNLIGTGEAEGSMNAANILKPALSRGEIQVIGATTFSEYRKHIEKDAALERRFQPVTVAEPSIDEAVEVLLGVRRYYEEFHRVRVPDEIARRCVTMSERYISDRCLPDKAIDLLDEACSCCTLANDALARYEAVNRRLKEREAALEEMQSRTEPPYEEIAEARADAARLREEAKALEPEALGREITVDDLARVIELWTGIPASRIRENELQKVAGLADALKKHIVGQDEAVDAVAAAVRRTRLHLSDRPRPASFIFVGPTGVGKTELVRRLSEELFDSTEPLIRVDMSEYMEKHTVSRLVGSPPGYVGYDEAGQLTEKVRRRPYSVVLFDEIEKAHPDVLNILLQILDEGFVTDAQGRKVSFANTVIVMTSNAGSNVRTNSLGFDKSGDSMAKERAEKALREFLRPEFLGRVDEIVVFRALEEGDLKKIAALVLEELKAPLAERGVRFGWDEEATALIAREASDGHSGARNIRRVLRRRVEDPLSELLLTDEDKIPALVSLTGKDGTLTLVTG